MKQVTQLEATQDMDSNDFLRENYEAFYCIVGQYLEGYDKCGHPIYVKSHPDQEDSSGIFGLREGYIFDDWHLLRGSRWAFCDDKEGCWTQIKYLGNQPDRVYINPGMNNTNFSKSNIIHPWNLFNVVPWMECGLTILMETEQNISTYSITPYRGISVVPCI